MKHLNISKFQLFFKVGHQRTVRAKKNIAVSFISKGLSILISFLIVPLTLNYITAEEYGVWMTISSIIAWFSFFDIGLGNGLRNKLAESLALKQIEQARTYISSAFAVISIISIFMFLSFTIISNYISWNKVLNTTLLTNKELHKIVDAVFFLFCIGFVSNILSSVLQSMQKYALKEILNIISQLLGLIGIYFLVKTTDSSLLNLCIVYAGKSPLVMFFSTLILFFGMLKFLRPRLTNINFKQASPLFKLGFVFFFNQILYLIINQSSVILIAQFFGPSDVTVYNLAVRYMSILSMSYLMVLTPFLSAFTEAYTTGEISWIMQTIKKINFVWLLSAAGTIILIFLYNPFFRIWVGGRIHIPLFLILALAVSGIINMWSSTYSLFLNGIGRIKLQTLIISIQAFLIFPLSYLFYKLGFGLVSIVAVQIIFYTANAIIFTKQYKKIINKSAQGIWSK
jgi:O-antigen/teichoic acid export membrane protein